MFARHRFAFAAALAVVLAAVFLAAPARALVTIDVTEGDVRPLPIAIPDFSGETGADGTAADITGVVRSDLGNSGLFDVLDQAGSVVETLGVSTRPRFAEWRAIGAEALVSGSVERENANRLRVDFRLWDPLQGEQVIGRQFFTTPENWRRVAHLVADAIYERLTGEDGYFDTRLVFVAESGAKNARVKRLAIADQDGANLTTLTDGDSLVLTPRFSPAGQTVAYMSFGADRPQVFLLDLETGQREVLGRNLPAMSFAPRFSPDGSRIIMSLQQGGNADIYEMDLASRRPRQITNTAAIDTAPSYSPDGRRIVFESDRGGSQQLYVMNADGSGVERISFGDGRYSTPVWSPRGDLVAFTKMDGGRFSIGVMRPDGTGERILTSGYHNEGPTWAPNGRVLAFFRESRGPQGGSSIWTVDVTGRNVRKVDLPTMASDPAWSSPR